MPDFTARTPLVYRSVGQLSTSVRCSASFRCRHSVLRTSLLVQSLFVLLTVVCSSSSPPLSLSLPLNTHTLSPHTHTNKIQHKNTNGLLRLSLAVWRLRLCPPRHPEPASTADRATVDLLHPQRRQHPVCYRCAQCRPFLLCVYVGRWTDDVFLLHARRLLFRMGWGRRAEAADLESAKLGLSARSPRSRNPYTWLAGAPFLHTRNHSQTARLIISPRP
eukprot:SAG11_NODE_280_length_11266_cov_28.949499_10_plen_219_part_00